MSIVLEEANATDVRFRHVQQEGAYGCALACIAMITGWSYRDVRKLFPDEVETSDGLSQWEILQALSWFGFALRIFGLGKYRYWPCENNGLADHSEKRHLLAMKQEGWPSLADAPYTIITVRATESNLHCVVMTQDGVVYDPFLSVPTTIDTYVEVIWAAGCYPVTSPIGVQS